MSTAPPPNGALSAKQAVQLRAQLYAFRMLSRNLPVPDDAIAAINGELEESEAQAMLDDANLFQANQHIPAHQNSIAPGWGDPLDDTTSKPAAQQPAEAPRLSSLFSKPRPPANGTSDLRIQHRIGELCDLRGPLPSRTRLRALIELKQLRLGSLQKKLRGEMVSATQEIKPKLTYLRQADPKVEAVLCQSQQRLSFYTPTMLTADAAESDEMLRMGLKQRQRLAQQRSAHRAYLRNVVEHSKVHKEYHKARRQRDAKLWRQVVAASAAKVRNEKLEKEKQEKERLRALKENNEEEYFRLLKSGKNTRLMQLLNQTDSYLQQIGALVSKQQQQISEDAPTPRKKKKKKEGAEGEGAEGEGAEGEAVEAAAPEAEAPAEEKPKVAGWDFEETQIPVGKEDEDEDEEMEGTEGEGAKDEGQSDASIAKLRSRKDDYYTLAHGVSEDITEQPKMLVGGTLKEYQMAGLKWMVSLHNNNLNGILADEMGLGKTIQTISLLAYLHESKGERGPWLVIVPLSTVSNWSNEFAKWCPEMKVVVYKGTPNERKRLMAQVIGVGDFHVVLTTYDYAMRDKGSLTKPFKGFRSWKYIIVDEGHRMKNAGCKLAQVLGTQYQSKNRILLTGTPLQNGIPELWSLLNFLLPTIFNSVENFENWFAAPLANTGEKIELTEEETILIVNRLHQVLRPFLLRRLKKEVMGQLPEKVEKVVKCDLSGWQKQFYHDIKVRGRTENDPTSGKGNRSLMNTLMQLRKVVNHPYLFLQEWNIDEDLVRASGKFRMMDNILPKMIRTGHRILLFSQMTSSMDVIEDYFQFRGYKYVRLDGSTKADDRELRMKQFLEDRSIFVFLLSTRAGGLGLNLQTADTVIIFDSDWNPQMDLQAQDRAHRIGQQAEVRVLRFVTVSAVEEQILARATEKLRLDAKVIQAGKFNNKSTNQDRKEALRAVLEEDNEEYDQEGVANDAQVNEMIARSEEERQLFDQIDAGTAPAVEDDTFDYLPPALFVDSERPVWYEQLRIHDDKDKESSEDDILEMGRGARRKSGAEQVTYKEMSEREFENLCREGDGDTKEPEKADSARPARSRKKRRRDESDDDDSDGESDWRPLANKLQQVYQAVYKLKDADGTQVCQLFVKLPTKKELPYYYTIIDNPIDMHAIQNRLNGKKKPYADIDAFKTDMILMFDNAEKFNLEGSEVYDCSLQLRKVYEREIKSAEEQLEQRSERPSRRITMTEPQKHPRHLDNVKAVKLEEPSVDAANDPSNVVDAANDPANVVDAANDPANDDDADAATEVAVGQEEPAADVDVVMQERSDSDEEV